MSEVTGLPGGVRVLVVEDEALIAEEIADRLRNLGCHVAGLADNAAAALEIAGREPLDLVLMDIRLKGPVDGIEAAGQLRDRHAVPIVFMTAHSDPATLERALALGPYGYVLKPFREHDLVLAMRLALRRAESERALWESAVVHGAILACIDDGVVATDTSGRVQYLNRRAEELTGWTSAQARGQPVKHVLDLHDEDSGVPVAGSALLRDMRLRGRRGVPCLLAGRQGGTTPVEVSAVDVADGTQALGIAITLHSLSERRQAEAKFRELVEASPDAMIISDNQGRMVLVNAQCERMFGHPRARLLGQPMTLLMPERFRERHRAALPRFFGSPQRMDMGPGAALYGLRADGSEFPIEISIGPLETDDGLLLAGTVRDVTQRRRAQQQLHDSEARFRSLTSLSSDWYWEQDEQFRFVKMSGDLTAATGISSDEHIGKTRWELPATDVTPAQWRAHRALLQAHLPFRDFVMRRPDVGGRSHWVSISGEPVFDAAGRFTGYRGIGKDITDRMVASRALQESLSIMHATLESTTDGIGVFAGDGRIRHCNRKYLEVWGLGPGRPSAWRDIARHCYDQLCEPEQLRASIRAVQEDPQRQTFNLLDCKDGRVLEAFSRPLEASAADTGRVWSIRDVTTQVRASAALQDSEARLKLFVDRAPAALAMLDRQLRYIITSDRWREDHGLTGIDLIGRSHKELFPDLPQRWLDAYDRVLAGEIVRADEDRWERADGTVRWSRWELVPWHQASGEVGGFVIFTEDIGAAQRAAEEIRQLNAGLERRVAERTAELAEARDRAQALARVKSEFAANMSHEIRTPLHAVIGLAGMGVRDAHDGASRATFRRIAEAGEHLLGVVNNVLDLSKLEAGKYTMAVQPMLLTEIISKVCEIIGAAASAKGLRFQATPAPGLPDWVEGDAQHLQQILINLLSNAVKFTDAGSVALAVRHDEGIATFEVSDTGIGIEPSQMSQLFQAFEQLDGSTTRRFMGTGLGLMLSQRLADLMHGSIDVRSQPGRGSIFTLRVPLKAVAAPAAGPPLPASAWRQRLAGLRVLAVDDLDVNQLIVRDMLLHEGAQAQVAESGARAIELLGLHGPQAFDVVLLDIQMPQMDGYEAARRLRALAPDLPIIGLTAHALAEERQRCLEAGMAAHVSKPFDADTLVAAIHACVGRAGAPPAQATAPPGGQRQDPVDWAALQARYASIPGFADKLADKIVASQGEVAQQLRGAVAEGDFERVRRLTHDILSVAAFVDAAHVLELAKAVRDARQSHPRELGDRTLALADAMTELVGFLATRHRV